MLHAHRIHFMHPAAEKHVDIEAPILPDMERLLARLRRASKQG
jgi:hypothetical protein